MRLGLPSALAALVSVSFCLADADADACGGCFAASSEVTVVTDHRMALALSKTQTVLWDQIRYSGDPREFAWVLPVREGASIDVGKEDFFTALDTVTRTVVYPPGRSSMPVCLGGCAASSSGAAGGGQDPETVTVLGEKVVGPYEAVTLRAIDPDALVRWLQDHGFAIPEATRPVIDAYQREGFDFIALRLRPDCGVRSMQPVRVTSPGADPTLPLRMVAAGAGASVGLTLYVIGEGRWRPETFPEALVDDTQLVWDVAAGRSNLTELEQAAMSTGAWVTEYAGGMGSLASLYTRACSGVYGSGSGSGGGTSTPPCPRDDAGADGATGGEAGAEDSGATYTEPSAPLPRPAPSACASFDDVDVALRGMRASDVWITKLRAELPSSSLGQDLRLGASPRQVAVSATHTAARAVRCTSRGGRALTCSSAPHEAASDLGAATLGALSSLALALLLRRRARGPYSGRANPDRTPRRSGSRCLPPPASSSERERP